MKTPAELALPDFQTAVGSHWQLDLPEGSALQLRLDKAEPAGTARAGARQPFSLIFRCPELAPGLCLRQGSYSMRHVELGALPIFLVPLQSDAAGIRYQAVFA